MPQVTFGSGMGQIASGNLEDSSVAIELLCDVSWREHHMPREILKEYTEEFVPWSLPRIRTSPSEALALSPVFGKSILQRDDRKDLNPFVATFFAEAVLRFLGIRTAKSRIVPTDEARKLPDDKHIVKFGTGTKFRWRATMLDIVPCALPYALVCDVIPNAASVDFVLRVKFGISEIPMNVVLNARVPQNMRTNLQAISKSCRHADALFAAFQPAETEWPAIEDAINIFRSEAYWRIAAARIFIGCTCPHFANVLTTQSAELVSIDHDSARFENGDDLRMLFRFVRRGSRVFDVLGEIATLTEDHVRDAVAEIPKHPACGTTDGLADYFSKRLRLWRSLHEAAPARTVAQAV
jgi:hypothetical protein